MGLVFYTRTTYSFNFEVNLLYNNLHVIREPINMLRKVMSVENFSHRKKTQVLTKYIFIFSCDNKNL